MTSQALTTTRDHDATLMEQVLLGGNLSALTPMQRLSYYRTVCDSLGLNPLTKPFDYLTLNGKLVLYAKKDATDQLRKKHNVSIIRLERDKIEGVYTVTAYARTADGREDSSIGAVNIDGLRGEALANAVMKAETKAKRRVTLSICGLGMLDETEIDSIPNAAPVAVDTSTGEIVDAPPSKQFRAASLSDKQTAPAASKDTSQDTQNGDHDNATPVPTKPDALLSLVNRRAQVPYDNAAHMFNAIRTESGNAAWNWPRGDDLDGWRAAYKFALAYAAKKTQPNAA